MLTKFLVLVPEEHLPFKPNKAQDADSYPASAAQTGVNISKETSGDKKHAKYASTSVQYVLPFEGFLPLLPVSNASAKARNWGNQG